MVNLNSGLANLRKKTGFTEFSTPDEYLRGFSKLLATSGTTLRRPASGSKKMGYCWFVAHRRNWTRRANRLGIERIPGAETPWACQLWNHH